MIAGTIVDRLDMSLTLTFSNEASQQMEQGLGTSMALLCSICITALISVTRDHYGQLYTPASKAVSLLRRTAGLITVRLLLRACTPAQVSQQQQLAWPLIETALVSSVVLVSVGFVSRQAPPSPEVDRLVTSVQWVFADNLGALLVDTRVKQDIVAVGILVFPKILCASGSPATSPVQFWLRGVAMAWINALVQLLTPDNVSSTAVGIDVVATLALSGGIQVLASTLDPSLTALLGYVEWHICSVLMALADARSVRLLDVVLASAAAYALLSTAIPAIVLPKSALGVATLVNVSTLVLVNTGARLWIETLKGMGAMDNLAVVLGTVPVLQVVSSLTRRWDTPAEPRHAGGSI